MRGFQANNCRLCQKVFCCKKCRIKHEKDTHNVFPDCEICVYGKFFFTNFNDHFLQHLESSHLPVHCVYCKKVFSTVEDLLQHKKCDYFQTKEISPKTPFKGNPAILLPTDDNDSPILQELHRQEYLNYILATSTPMQRGEEPNLMFEKSKEVITPVDKPSRVTNKSIIKKTDSAKSDEQLSKRRVTFGETPANNFEKHMIGSMTGDQGSSKLLESLDGQSLNQKSNGNFTPANGMSTGQFYSAKTDTGQFYSAKTDISSKPERENCNIKNSTDSFTPVGIPTRSKLINVKGDIYKKQDQEINNSIESREYNAEDKIKNLDNLDEVSMELCTPAIAKYLNPSGNIVNGQDGVYKESMYNKDISENVKNLEENYTKDVLNFCTPAKTSNSGKVVVKGDIYRDSEKDDTSQLAEITKKSEESGNNYQNKSKDGLEGNKNTNAEEHDTLWLSAINLEETNNDSKQQNDENNQPVEKNEYNALCTPISPSKKQNDENNQPVEKNEYNPLCTPISPPRNSQKRVSIVMPTPILKTTNVQMKFQFPAHLSSTPILSSGAVKLKQTKLVKDISTRVIQQQTPYKTPQGKLYELIQRKLVDANRRRNLTPLPDIEAGPSIAGRNIELLENIKEDYSASDGLFRNISCKTINKGYEDTHASLPFHEPETSVSVSSMTESNLWTSMTRIVKSVLGGFSTVSRDCSDMSTDNNFSSSKRQLSDSDTGDFLEAPRLKRFKFTDIKCRRSIRDLRALELPCNLPVPEPPLASIEIVKSVSTLYGHCAMRIQCDKATQTDNYLLYGWHPDV